MWSTNDDGALSALFWLFDSGMASVPAGPVLFMGAKPGEWTVRPGCREWQCEQAFAPYALALERAGLVVSEHTDASGFSATLLLPARQRQAARAALARALQATAPGGLVVVAVGNNDGARSVESDLRALLGAAQVQSKFKSRVIWGQVDPAAVDHARVAEWLQLDAVCRIGEGDEGFWSRPGLFAWDRIDAASALLLAQLPATLSGRVADLGAGWGALSRAVARQCGAVTAIDLFEADARALEPARRNLAEALADRPSLPMNVHWHDVTAGVPGQYDVVISNPPFHIGRADAPDLGKAFLDVAASALRPGGEAWIVANRHLPYEALLSGRFSSVDTVIQRDGFKVLHARGPRR